MRRLAITIALLSATAAQAEPDPGRDEAERGFAALRAHDLDRAEALTRAALERATTGEVIGAAWFNLGAIAEARGDRDAAIAAYKSSMTARPHRTTRARLEALDPDHAGALDPFAPKPMAGPFATLDGICRSLADSACTACNDSPKTIVAPGTHGIAAPFVAFAVTTLPCGGGALVVAVELAAGWYLASVPPQDTDLLHCGAPAYRSGDATMHGRIATLEYRGGASCSYHERGNWEWREHGAISIGVGRSDAPSITPAIAIDHARMTWSPDGSFDLEGDVGLDRYGSADDTENRRGRHRLVFP